MSPEQTGEPGPMGGASTRLKLFEAGGVSGLTATADDGPALQALLEACDDFFDLTTGAPAGPAEAQSLFTALPQGKSYEDKHVVVLQSEAGDIVGVMDAVSDYPHDGDWWLGLMLIHPRHRGRGLGAEVYNAFDDWASGEGARKVFLGVKGQNEKGFHFWEKLGFETTEWRPPRLMGAKESVVLVMERATREAD